MLITAIGSPGSGKTTFSQEFIRKNVEKLAVYDKRNVYDYFKQDKFNIYVICILESLIFLLVFVILLTYYHNKHIKFIWEVKNFIRASARHKVSRKLLRNKVCDVVIIDEGIRQRLLSFAERTGVSHNSFLLKWLLCRLPKPDILVIFIVEKDIILGRLKKRKHGRDLSEFSEKERDNAIERSTDFLEWVKEDYEGNKICCGSKVHCYQKLSDFISLHRIA